MRRRAHLLAVSTLAVACAAPAPRLSADHAAAIQDSVRAQLSAQTQSFAAGDWDAAAALYADDASFRWVENGAIRYRAASDIEAALAALPAGTRIETTYDDVLIEPLAPGVASVIAGFESRFVDSAGSAFSFDGVITMTVVHREDGWRFLNGHTSSPTTPRQ